MMKKRYSLRTIRVLSTLILLALLAGCRAGGEVSSGGKNSPDPNISSMPTSEKKYTGSLYKGNYVYAAAMNLAWNELAENVLHDKVQLLNGAPSALETTQLLNSAPFTKKDMDAESYYVKSGFGQKTVDAINKEVKTKFPEKTFPDIKIDMAEKDFIAYAYFLKKVEYLEPFSKLSISFYENGKASSVRGFWSETEKQKENIKVHKYWNDDKFIISLKLKGSVDELFLAKGFENEPPEKVVEEINTYGGKEEKPLKEEESFHMPYLNFTHQREYAEMLQQVISNKGFEGYIINTMLENISFTMDEAGARVENEAVIAFQQAVKNKRLFLLNKPFWVVMKHKNSQNPYFILGVQNKEIMEPAG